MDLSQFELNGISTALVNGPARSEALAYSAVNRGAGRLQAKDYEGALAEFRRASAYKTDYPDAYRYLGRTYALMGRTRESLDAYEKGVRLAPTDDAARQDLANAYLMAHEYGKAEVQFHRIVRTNPTAAGPAASLGYLYMESGRLAEAETQFDTVLRLAPRDAASHYGMGLLRNKQGEYAEAVGHFERAIELRKDYVDAFSDLANSYQHLGDLDQAQAQADALFSLGTPRSVAVGYEVELRLLTPKIAYEDVTLSSFNTLLGSGTTLDKLDPRLATPGAVVTLAVAIHFNQPMDALSVKNLANWNISKATGGAGGAYDYGITLHRENSIQILPIPVSVTYDADKQTAMVYFKVSQNATGTGVMDPMHWVFRFSGKDIAGNPMDPHGDEYDRDAWKPF